MIDTETAECFLSVTDSEQIPASPGHPTMHDYEYRRCGMCNVFIACEPLAGKRMLKVTERRTKHDWVYFLEEIEDQYSFTKCCFISF